MVLFVVTYDFLEVAWLEEYPGEDPLWLLRLCTVWQHLLHPVDHVVANHFHTADHYPLFRRLLQA